MQVVERVVLEYFMFSFAGGLVNPFIELALSSGCHFRVRTHTSILVHARPAASVSPVRAENCHVSRFSLLISQCPGSSMWLPFWGVLKDCC